jgi:glycosyltransferase involved in cell wall biosynthesis
LEKYKSLSQRLIVLGELSDEDYKRALAKSQFLWHPGIIDNGTYSVVEAASVGVPSLSSDYPAMREMDAQFSLGLSFSSSRDVEEMAVALKEMERNVDAKRMNLPREDDWRRNSIENLADSYFSAVREWL